MVHIDIQVVRSATDKKHYLRLTGRETVAHRWLSFIQHLLPRAFNNQDISFKENVDRQMTMLVLISKYKTSVIEPTGSAVSHHLESFTESILLE